MTHTPIIYFVYGVCNNASCFILAKNVIGLAKSMEDLDVWHVFVKVLKHGEQIIQKNSKNKSAAIISAQGQKEEMHITQKEGAIVQANAVLRRGLNELNGLHPAMLKDCNSSSYLNRKMIPVIIAVFQLCLDLIHLTLEGLTMFYQEIKVVNTLSQIWSFVASCVILKKQIIKDTL